MTFWKVWKSVKIGQMDLTEFLHLMISLPVVELKVKAVFSDFTETLCFFLYLKAHWTDLFGP